MSNESGAGRLGRLQTELQRSILTGDDDFAGIVVDPNVDAATRLRIYSDAYRLRLIDALAANFPALRRFVGDEEFGRLARGYLATFPSGNPSVRWFGHRLPEYLHDNAELALVELARLEWAIAGAFDAEDAPPIELQALAIAAEKWPQLRFKLHPSVRTLKLQTNAVPIFIAFTADEEPPAPAALESDQPWVIWRRELTVRFREQTNDEAQALATIAANGTFEAMCEELCQWCDEEAVPVRAASLLKTWVMEEMIAAVIVESED